MYDYQEDLESVNDHFGNHPAKHDDYLFHPDMLSWCYEGRLDKIIEYDEAYWTREDDGRFEVGRFEDETISYGRSLSDICAFWLAFKKRMSIIHWMYEKEVFLDHFDGYLQGKHFTLALQELDYRKDLKIHLVLCSIAKYGKLTDFIEVVDKTKYYMEPSRDKYGNLIKRTTFTTFDWSWYLDEAVEGKQLPFYPYLISKGAKLKNVNPRLDYDDIFFLHKLKIPTTSKYRLYVKKVKLRDKIMFETLDELLKVDSRITHFMTSF